MITTEIWPLAQEALRALGATYDPEMIQPLKDAGVDMPVWFVLFRALTLDPEPLKAARLRLYFPYTSPALIDSRLAEALRRGLMEQAGSGYRLSETGRDLARRAISAAYAKMSTLEPLPRADLERLAELLQCVVDCILDAPEPPGRTRIRDNHRLDPGPDAHPLVRIDQYLSDLGDFRDDAHTAAWNLFRVDGHAWEAFNIPWRDGSVTPDQLADRLAARGFTVQDYAAGLDGLVERGWAAKSEDGSYRVTEQGKRVRIQAEADTNRYFYLHWTCSVESEAQELRSLLVRLRDALRTVATV